MIIVLIYRFLPGFFSRVATLLGLVLGTIVAIPFGLTNFSRIADAEIFQLTLPFHFGVPTFAVGAAISMFVVMLVIMTETTASGAAAGARRSGPGPVRHGGRPAVSGPWPRSTSPATPTW